MAYERDDETALLIAALEKDLRNTTIRMAWLRKGFVEEAVDELDKRTRRLQERIEKLKTRCPIKTA